ncbi:hypothetical protein SMD44_00966 [Streptomyces alboflavus]|uniref:Uncharacterized protein n=1 Tax=Streptomyces alboflavus TaxID=67267 RepID=A0A1Z1W557_9ACTN|nr:hypothetical protein [Streptomyces alboflavus]ARX81568.1 hypothetical protein SMD44_00966 [Streptomyces alboflavus]
MRGSRGADPRQPAYDAVYAHLSALGDHMPADRVHRNAMIWRAVHAALDAMEPQLDTVQRALREITATAELEERAARDTPLGREECRIVHSSRASGLREALNILGVQTVGGWDGPSVREAVANDRNWDVEKGGE